jgi:CRISPR-associated endonuclease/helicase Cas3
MLLRLCSFTPNGQKGTQRVYGKELLAWSLEILVQLPPTPTDRDLAEATHQLYERVVPTEEWQHELTEGRTTLDELQRILGCYTIDLSDEALRERFTARRGMVTVEVLPVQFVEEADQLKEQGELWRLPELLVPVPIWWFREFAGCFAPNSDLRVIQADLPYTEVLGATVPARIEGSAAILE